MEAKNIIREMILNNVNIKNGFIVDNDDIETLEKFDLLKKYYDSILVHGDSFMINLNKILETGTGQLDKSYPSFLGVLDKKNVVKAMDLKNLSSKNKYELQEYIGKLTNLEKMIQLQQQEFNSYGVSKENELVKNNIILSISNVRTKLKDILFYSKQFK